MIVNNGSSDNTALILETWNRQLNIKIIHNEENIGFGPANNQGAKEAEANVLIFINNDVIINGDYVSMIAATLKAYPYDICGPEYHDQDTGWNKFGDKIIPYLAGWCLGMRKRTFEALRGFDEQYAPGDYEDVDLCHMAARAGRLLRPIDLPLKHLFNQSGRQLKNRREMTEKHRQLFAEKWGLPLK